jgi:hypothetical protein
MHATTIFFLINFRPTNIQHEDNRGFFGAFSGYFGPWPVAYDRLWVLRP